MTFKDILDITRNRIDEVDSSQQVDIIIKSAINDAYINELSKYDKRVSTANIPVINGTATLPDDIDSIESISPALIKGERRIGNVILSNRDIVFYIAYSYIREELINDNDELDMSNKFKILLSTYACYLYFEYRKKTNIADMFLNEYNFKLSRLVDEDNFGEEIVQDVYYNVGDE